MELKNGSKILALVGAAAGVFVAFKVKPSVMNYVLFGGAGLGAGYFLGKKLEPVKKAEQLNTVTDHIATVKLVFTKADADKVAQEVWALLNGKPAGAQAAKENNSKAILLKKKLEDNGFIYVDGKAVSNKMTK